MQHDGFFFCVGGFAKHVPVGICSDVHVPVEHRGGTSLRVGIFRASSRTVDTRDDSGSKRCKKLNLRCDASKKWS
jgi:hypothetical protein